MSQAVKRIDDSEAEPVRVLGRGLRAKRAQNPLERFLRGGRLAKGTIGRLPIAIRRRCDEIRSFRARLRREPFDDRPD